MRAQKLVFFLAGLSLSLTAAAEPIKLPMHKAEEPAAQPPPPLVAVVAEKQDQTSEANQQQRPAPKPRRARVTTCRCGDQNPSD